MSKKLKPVFGLVLFVFLFFISCTSSPREEFTPLDYTEEDVITNEISNIEKMLESESTKALWRATLLKNNVGNTENTAVNTIVELCGQKVIKQYYEAFRLENNLEAKRLLSSLEAVNYPLDELLTAQKTELENKITSATPGFAIQQDASHSVSDYISGTVTIWVDLGIHVSKGLGYANRAIGSGFFIDRSGYIVTNYHVIQSEVDPEYEGYSRLYIKLSSDPETRIPARVVGWDPLLDLALLKTEIDAPYIFPLGSSIELDVGEKIYAIGAPAGLDWTITSGIVSAKGRRLLTMGPVMQIDAAINAGNSGGPILDENGNVEAVAFAGVLEHQGLNFAIPIEYLKAQLSILAAGGLREHGWIGAYGKDNPVNEFSTSPRGLLVHYMMPGGSAARSGLNQGDVITAINGISIAGIDDFHNILKSLLPETIVKLSVYSPQSENAGSGVEKILSVYLEKRPEQPGYEIYQRDVISNAMLPILGMELTPASDKNNKKYTVTTVLPGESADESGFSVHDPVDIVKIEVPKTKDVLYAQLYTKKRKNGYFEVSIVVGAPLDSPYYF